MKNVKNKKVKIRKKSTTSNGKVGQPKKEYEIEAFGKKETFKRSYHGEDFKKDIYPDPVEDSEAVEPMPDDEAAKHKYPPPKKNKTFRKIWMQFIDSLVSRENFKVGHLNNLEILCDLYVEYEELQKFIRTKGRSYLSVGRSGEVWKFYPEVSHLSKVQLQIKNYTAMLGLVPKKDHGTEAGGKSEWE